ncbi:NAD(P)H-dependent flavin oxidoreductase [Myroides sp. LJL115]
MMENSSFWKTKISSLLNIQYPIIQAPMFGVTTPEMVAKASNSGALGSLALGDLPPEKCRELILKTKELTNKPFAVNLFLHQLPALNHSLEQSYNKTKNYLEEKVKEKGLQVVFPSYDSLYFTNYKDQVDTIIASDCKILSFTFGTLDEDSIEKLKKNDVFLIGTCTSLQEACLLEASQIDIICVQSNEAGGHQGTFLKDKSSQIGGLALLNNIFQNVKVPIIYAGGLCNAQTIVAAKTLGAQGFSLGTYFLGALESALNNFEKQVLMNATQDDLVLTNSFSGRYARGIGTCFTTEMEKSGLILPYPLQNKLTSALRMEAKKLMRAEFLSLWAGQSLGIISQESTETLILNLVKQVNAYLDII